MRMHTAGILMFIQLMIFTKYGFHDLFPCFPFRPNEKTASELFRELDASQVDDLHQLYKEDFDIHGYDRYKYYTL